MNKEKKKTMVPKLRFPEFQEDIEWNVFNLHDISTPINEKVGNLLLTPVSITAGYGFVSQSEKFGRDISGEQYKNYVLLKEGEFAYNKGNSKKYPQGCIYKLKEFKIAAAPNAFICFRFKSNFVADFFQGYFDNNYHGKQLIKFITSGARSDGLLNVNSDDFFSIQLPTPPKRAEQQKIAATLTSLDELISAQSEKLKTLQAHMKGLKQQLFPAEGETVPRVRFREFVGSGDWKETILGQVAKYENGKAHEQDIAETGAFVVVNSKFISTNGEIRKYTNMPFCLAKKGDILMVLSDVPNGKAIAKCFFVDADNLYTVNQRICKLTPSKAVGIMLFYSLNRNPYFLSFDDGVKQTNLRNEDVLNCPVFLPSDLKEQQKIADCLTSLDELITSQSQKLEALKAQKKGLIQQLFPGINSNINHD